MRPSSRLVAGFLAVGCVTGFAVSEVAAQGKGDANAGAAIYKTECAKCHGDSGTGDGPRGQQLKTKPSNWSAGGGGLKSMDDQKIFDSIAKGGKAVGKSAAMPAYPKLSEADVWNLVAFVKSLVK